ncbi:nitrate reductase [Reinekea blandensis]|nr:nitrate reductase [Reinekea blandensis]
MDSQKTTTHTTCPYCGVGCGVSVRGGGSQRRPIIDATSDHPANQGRLCSKGSQLSATLEDRPRLLTPMVNHQPVTWDSALDSVTEAIRDCVDNYGPNSVAFYLSGQLLTEDYYVANKLMKGFIGSANVDTNSRLCMSSAVAAYKRAFGSDSVPTCYEDVELTDLLVVVGSNMAWTHPVLYQRIEAARVKRPELKVVVIDPRATATASQADMHLALKPGTDGYLFTGLLTYLHEQGLADDEFIANHTKGFREALKQARYSVVEVAQLCQLPEHQVRDFYERFITENSVVSLYSMGINQSNSGTDKCNAIINAHLASGKIGKPGSGPFSITGQPNAMGGREVGGLANMLAAHMDFSDEHCSRVGAFWEATNMARQPGLKALDMIDAIEQGKIRFIWIMGTNPALSLPDSQRVKKALSQCNTVVVSDCIANTETTALANILLPATTWGEKNGTVTNSERRISRQRPFRTAPGEAKHDWWAICEIAKRLGHQSAFSYSHPSTIFDEHARLTAYDNNGQRDLDLSGLVGLTQQAYDELTPIQWPVNAEHPNGCSRLFTDHQFFTPDRKANFVPVSPKLPELSGENEPLVLNTGRSRDQWHTRTRTGLASKLNSHERWPTIYLNPDDATTLSVTSGQLVILENQRARAFGFAEVDSAQLHGSVFLSMHWHDQVASRSGCNALTDFISDPHSGQPQFKQTRVSCKPATMAWWRIRLSQLPELSDDRDYHWIIPIKNGVVTIEAWQKKRPVMNEGNLEDDNHQRFQTAWVEPEKQKNAYWLDQSVTAIVIESRELNLAELNQLILSYEQSTSPARISGELIASDGHELGRRICTCFETHEADIDAFLADHPSAQMDELTRSLKCGSHCGSCRPELRQRIRASEHKSFADSLAAK